MAGSTTKVSNILVQLAAIKRGFRMTRLEKILFGESLSKIEDKDLRTAHESMKRVSDFSGAIIRIALLSVLAGFIFAELTVLTNSWIDLAFIPLFLIVFITILALTVRCCIFLIILSCSIFFARSFEEFLLLGFPAPEYDESKNTFHIPNRFPGFWGKTKYFFGILVFTIMVFSIFIAISGVILGLTDFIK